MHQILGYEDVQPVLFYHDDRGGEQMVGWWFASSVGWDWVWARCASRASPPPANHWRIPWDAAPSRGTRLRLCWAGYTDRVRNWLLAHGLPVSAGALAVAASLREDDRGRLLAYEFLECANPAGPAARRWERVTGREIQGRHRRAEGRRGAPGGGLSLEC